MGNHWVGRRPSRVSGEETDRSRRKERRGWGKGRGKGGEGVEIEEWGMGEIRDQDQGVGERMGHYGYKSQGFEVGGGGHCFFGTWRRCPLKEYRRCFSS